jgi:hypothetical protein
MYQVLPTTVRLKTGSWAKRALQLTAFAPKLPHLPLASFRVLVFMTYSKKRTLTHRVQSRKVKEGKSIILITNQNITTDGKKALCV